MYQLLTRQNKVLFATLGLLSMGHPGVDIGQRVQASGIVPGKEVLVLVRPNQLSLGFEFTCQQLRYRGVASGGRFEFFSTDDPRFTTPEGISTRTMLSQLPRATTKVQLIAGWAQVCRLPSGWNCAFAFAEKLTPTSRVAYFYKSK